jgi:hypothetical protein
MTPDDPLTELQLRGIAVASEVFDRLAADLGGGSAGRNGSEPRLRAGGGATADPIGQQQLRTAAARMIDLFAGLFQQTFETYVELAQSIVQPPSADVAMSAGGCTALSLSGRAGRNAAATVWIHNPTPEPVGEVVLRLTELTAHTGARIDASLARFVPGTLGVVAGATVSSLLSLTIPPRTPPGIYYGHVLAAGLPSAGLPLGVVVEEAEE